MYFRKHHISNTIDWKSISFTKTQRLCIHGCQKAIAIAIDTYNADTITIEAQTYARALYEKLGFQQTSDPFLEDGIEHIQMQYHK